MKRHDAKKRDPIFSQPWARSMRVIGMVLDHESPVPGLEAISSAVEALDPDAVENQRIATRWEEVFERTTNVVDTLLNAHDHLVGKTYPEHVCHLPVQGVETLEYDMSEEKIERLLSAAQEKWPAVWLFWKDKGSVRHAQLIQRRQRSRPLTLSLYPCNLFIDKMHALAI